MNYELDPQEKAIRKDYLGSMIDHSLAKLYDVSQQIEAYSESQNPDDIPIVMGYINDANTIAIRIMEWYNEWKQLDLELSADPSDPSDPSNPSNP